MTAAWLLVLVLVLVLWLACIAANAILLGWLDRSKRTISGWAIGPNPVETFLLVFLAPVLFLFVAFRALYVKTQRAARP